MTEKEKGSLSDFSKLYKEYSDAKKWAKGIVSTDFDERTSAEDGLRKIVQKFTPGMKDGDPILSETYNKFAKAQLKRTNDYTTGYFNAFALDLVDQLPAKGLESKLFDIPLVQLNEESPNAELHNSALQIHSQYIAFRDMNKNRDEQKTNDVKYIGAVAEIAKKHTTAVLASQGYSKEEIALFARATEYQVRTSPTIARAVGDGFESLAKKSFSAFFELDEVKKAGYTSVDYVKESIAYLPDRDKAMELVSGLIPKKK